MPAASTSDGVAFAEQNQLLVDALRGADWSTPVPTCPGWTLEKLLRHIGRGDRWAAKIVSDRAAEPVDHRAVANGTPPDGVDATLEWLGEGVQLLFDAVDATGAGTEVWTFIGPRSAEWWVHRRLHETLVHRADAEIALERRFDVDPRVAAESTTEYLAIIADQIADQPATDDPPVALLASDVPDADGGSWVLPQPGGVASEAPSGATLTGRASDLLLVVTRRQPPPAAAVAVTGNAELFDRWLAGVNF